MEKTTLCYSCLGCNKLENLRFTGTDDCRDYLGDVTVNTFIDNICKEWEQQKLEKLEKKKD